MLLFFCSLRFLSDIVNIPATCEYFDSAIKMDRHNTNLYHLKDTKQKRALVNMFEKFSRFMYRNLDENYLTDINFRINNNTIFKIQKKRN